jgi:hypothetical protein
MSRLKEPQTNLVTIRLSPSTWFFIIQGLLIHYKLTNVLDVNWLYISAPTLTMIGISLSWAIGNVMIQIWHNITRRRR